MKPIIPLFTLALAKRIKPVVSEIQPDLSKFTYLAFEDNFAKLDLTSGAQR
ncbi:hypothetical protein DSO57_1034793 [Entomophthora muscae]|uniref:Uncharacterized protein n=1 Tax=Entomophthora muscae TaxID=34485 RepID=A0ACC2REE6_9FUNG|nr:hypothetical protein DSO57_1034793 [Entomophthora muscae]